MKKRKFKLDRLLIIDIILFILIIAITLTNNILKYGPTGNLPLIIMILSFNVSIGLLIVLAVNKLVKVSKTGFLVFIFYITIISFLYWYFISTVLHFYYGTFLSLGGLYYFIATRTWEAMVVFYIASGFVILSSTFLFYYFSRKYFFKDQLKRVINKKVKTILILTPIFILLIVIIAIPKGEAYEASPLIDFIAQLVLAKEPAIIDINGTKIDEKILDLNIKIKKPNFVFILLESISAERLPLYGYERDTTPNIDDLAKKSIVFNKAYSSSAHSDYAQTAFLSSRYALVDSYRNFFDINYPRKFMWDILKEYNYTTSYISSQDDNWANMINYYNKDTLDLYYYSLSDGKYDYGSGNAKKDYDEHTINKSIQWLNQTLNKSNPFYMYINLQGTHYEYNYPKNNSKFLPDKPSESTTYYSIAEGDYNKSVNAYDNSVYYADKQLGILFDYLQRKNLFKNTIIVISSDHGESFEKRGKNIRHGYGVYEEEVRVPLIIYLPGGKPRIINDRVRHVDVIPTLLDIVKFNSSQEFQGKPMTKNPTTFLMTQNQNFKIGMVKDDIKYMMNMLSYTPEAYNLTEDPEETNNLIKSKKDKRFYYREYGYVLLKWYRCQLKYYAREKWTDGEVIDC